MAFFNLQNGSKYKWLIRLICFFWLIEKIICCKLWLADRVFPVVPAFPFLFVPSPVHLVLYIISLAGLVALLLYPRNHIIGISFLTIELLSCLLDQNRWQPWEFQFFFFILAFIINRKKEENILSVLGFILASMYFYSGISKINPVFVHAVWFQIILTQLLHIKPIVSFQPVLYHMGYMLGLLEAIASIGLFFQHTRKMAGTFFIVMHLIVLLIFGPLGINYDVIIWPWNILLPLLVYIFVFKTSGFSVSFKPVLTGMNRFIFILFGIMPVLNFFGYWGYFFSASLFSARPPDLYICIPKATIDKSLKPFCIEHKSSLLCDSNSCLIYTRDWAFAETMSPENPEVRIYQSMKDQMLKRYPKMNATFILYIYSKGKRIRSELK